MNVLFFVHRYWPEIGGVEKYVRYLARAVSALGHHVTVITGDTRGNLAERDTVDGVAVYRFPAMRSPTRSRLWLLRHRDLFRRADVVHVSNTHMLEYLWRMLGPLVDRRKAFLSRHGMSLRYPVPLSERARAVRSTRLATAVAHDGRFIEKWLGVKPDFCPDQGLFPTADSLAHRPPASPNSAVFIGRLDHDSGIDSYLHGVELIARQGANHDSVFTLHVYGDGSRARELRGWVDRASLPVVFHGPSPDAQDRFFDAAFAFVDGRMAIQEAMARRRLVFAAHSHPLKRDYVCGEAFSPFLVPVGSGRELAEKLRHYLDHPGEAARLVDSAYQHVRSLSWTRTAQAYLEFWHRCLQPSHVGSAVRTVPCGGRTRAVRGADPTVLQNRHPPTACGRLEFLRLFAELNCESLGFRRAPRYLPSDNEPIPSRRLLPRPRRSRLHKQVARCHDAADTSYMCPYDPHRTANDS